MKQLDGQTHHVPNPSGFCLCGCGQKTGIARLTCVRDGTVRGQHVRFLHGHARRHRGPEYVIDHETGCWVWARHIDKVSGYGHINVAGKVVGAHRHIYTRFIGAIPENLELDHLCRNRACVNPSHLQPVTHAENARRGSRTVLSESQVAEIRSRVMAGETQTAVAAAFGIHSATVSRIVRCERWAS